MKIQHLFFLTIILFCLGSLNAQTNNEWQPVLNSPDGTNNNVGVVANYSLTTCNSHEVVLLKLANNNKHTLKAEWINLVQTKDGRKIYGNAKVSLNLAPLSENTGDCDGDVTVLVIKLSDFGISKENFETFIASDFNLYAK